MATNSRRYVVTGLLNGQSLAWRIGETLRERGAEVIYTVQNEALKARFVDESPEIDPAALEFRFLDATDDAQAAAVFAELAPVHGVVHSIAYGNPHTLLQAEFHTDATEDVLKSFHVSCVTLATLAKHAQPAMPDGGSIVALTFDSAHAYPFYNWMGVNKAALEAMVRALARRHGRDRVRVNAVSAGPVSTKAASKIPGFQHLLDIWDSYSPLPWDAQEGKQDVANAVAFLLGDDARRITGQVLHVDGGAGIMGGPLLDHERAG